MDERFKKIDINAKKVWFIYGIVKLIVIMTINGAAIYLYEKLVWALILTIPISIFGITISPNIEYREWSYKISKYYIIFNHGIIIRSQSFIPVERIQHVDIVSGPILRIYNLVEITINTASRTHRIKGIHNDEAKKIVDNLNALILERIANESNE